VLPKIIRGLSASDAACIHGTVVSVAGLGVLLLGPSGSGKSDLALRLIDRGAVLVADDAVALTRRSARLVASAPGHLRGKLEVRSIGIVEFPSVDEAVIALAVDLGANGSSVRLRGIMVPTIALASQHASAPMAVERAVMDQSAGTAS